MKDSQKKKQPLKKKKSNKTIQTSVTPYFLQYYQLLKRNFAWIVIGITIINLFLGIGIVYLIGKIESIPSQNSLAEIVIPELPILPTTTTNLPVSAQSVLVFEKDSRTVVMQKQGTLRFAPASTTKIMTALVVLEHYDVNQYLVSFGVSEVQGSKMGLVEGEEIKVIDLLYGLMLPSGNDAAHVLAANYPGGPEAFMARMNAKAQELRLYNTKFYDPAGLDDKNYTTAFDLARLALIALENNVFKQVVFTRYITVYDRMFMYEHRLENLNRLLYSDGIFGVKTGYTDEAGQVLVTSLESNGKTYIIVVLKSEDRFSDTQTILREVIEKIQLETF